MDAEVRPVPEPNVPPVSPELATLLVTLDAVSVLAEQTAEDSDGDRQRAGLLDLVLIDYRVLVLVRER